MTQGEKASAYDEAIKRAKEWEGNPAAVEYIFPELAESEDEKIRKELVDFIKRWKEKANDFTSARVLWTSDEEKCDKYLAWLERQGEKKSVVVDVDKMVLDYSSKDEYDGNRNCGKPVNCMIRAYRQGINDAISKVIIKPIEWSEEDDIMVEDILDSIDDTIAACDYHEMESWLNSLKQRIGG